VKILDKAYEGKFYIVAFIVSLAVTVLTSQQVTDLHLPWVGPVLTALGVLGMLLQRYTTVGDSGDEG
jgi:hypothetical protein